MQSLHFPPNEPHACTSEPTRHTPRASQQPVGQVDGPHVPPSVVLSTRASVMVPPPSRMASSRLERPQPTAEAEASPATKRRESASRTTRAKEVGEAKGNVSRMGGSALDRDSRSRRSPCCPWERTSVAVRQPSAREDSGPTLSHSSRDSSTEPRRNVNGPGPERVTGLAVEEISPRNSWRTTETALRSVQLSFATRGLEARAPTRSPLLGRLKMATTSLSSAKQS